MRDDAHLSALGERNARRGLPDFAVQAHEAAPAKSSMTTARGADHRFPPGDDFLRRRALDGGADDEHEDRD